MLQGHGDDTFQYPDIRMNFSSNIFAHADMSELKLGTTHRQQGWCVARQRARHQWGHRGHLSHRPGTGFNPVVAGLSSVISGFSFVSADFSSVRADFSSVGAGFSSVGAGFSFVIAGFSFVGTSRERSPPYCPVHPFLHRPTAHFQRVCRCLPPSGPKRGKMVPSHTAH